MSRICAYTLFWQVISTFWIAAIAADGGTWDALVNVLETRGYEDIDPRYDMYEIGFHQSAVLNDTLWIHGGYVGYDNGTKSSAPNTYLRGISLTKKFALVSRDEAPVKFLLQREIVPEISAGVLWGYGGKLIEIAGESEQTDKNFPGWNAFMEHTMWVYDILSSTWSSKNMMSASGKGLPATPHPLSVNVPSLSKGYYITGGGKAMAMLVYDFGTSTWTSTSTPWTARNSGKMLYLPIGTRGMLVTLSGFTGVGKTRAAGLDKIEIFNLNIAAGSDSPEGIWSETQTAVAANSSHGIPEGRINSCAVAVGAPDGSSYQIFMYGGQSMGEGYRVFKDLWVLSIPSFEWILVDNGSGGPMDPMASQTHPGQREGHTCDIVGRSVMMMFGGRVLPNFSRSSETTGLYALNLTSLKWIEEFDPVKSDTEYKVPQEIYSVIGGNAMGGSSKLAIGGIADDELRATFSQLLVSGNNTKKTDDHKHGGRNGTDTESTLSEPNRNAAVSGKGAPVAAIAGGVGGCLGAVAGALVAFCLYKRRKKRLSDLCHQGGYPYAKHELACEDGAKGFGAMISPGVESSSVLHSYSARAELYNPPTELYNSPAELYNTPAELYNTPAELCGNNYELTRSNIQ